jgi:hypothetical protein
VALFREISPAKDDLGGSRRLRLEDGRLLATRTETDLERISIPFVFKAH